MYVMQRFQHNNFGFWWKVYVVWQDIDLNIYHCNKKNQIDKKTSSKTIKAALITETPSMIEEN